MSSYRPIGPNDHTIGPPDAPYQLVEYGDYECPYCGAAYPIVKSVQRRMGDSLLLAYRHFPLTQMHPHAEHAAEIAEAAGEHGRFWAMHDVLFIHQQRWTTTASWGMPRGSASIRAGRAGCSRPTPSPIACARPS